MNIVYENCNGAQIPMSYGRMYEILLPIVAAACMIGCYGFMAFLN